MEVRFSEALPLDKALRGSMPPGVGVRPQGEVPAVAVMPNRPSDNARQVRAPKELQDEQNNQLDRNTTEELVKRSAELLSLFDRELKYEMKADAGVVQMQVIDSRDGRVVRKVPADEVIKFIEHIRSQIDDRVDVKA